MPGNSYIPIVRFLYAECRISALPEDSSLYDNAFGYPMLEGGFLLADYSHIRLHEENRHAPYISGLGYMVAAYGAFRRDVVRSGRFSLSYSLENLVSDCRHARIIVSIMSITS